MQIIRLFSHTSSISKFVFIIRKERYRLRYWCYSSIDMRKRIQIISHITYIFPQTRISAKTLFFANSKFYSNFIEQFDLNVCTRLQISYKPPWAIKAMQNRNMGRSGFLGSIASIFCNIGRGRGKWMLSLWKLYWRNSQILTCLYTFVCFKF